MLKRVQKILKLFKISQNLLKSSERLKIVQNYKKFSRLHKTTKTT